MEAKQILKIDYFGREIQISLQRSRNRRRTLSLIVQKNGEAQLRVPYRTSNLQIRNFVIEKAPWIVQAIDKVDARQKAPAKCATSFQHLGYPIEFTIIQSPLLKKGGFCEWQDGAFFVQIPFNTDPDKIGSAAYKIIDDWRQTEAFTLFKVRTDLYAAKIGVQYKDIKIAAQKTRWGSCDQFGRLRFNWHVIQCPLDIIDYLIVHELCHIPHPNHSPRFWKAVEKIIPDYKSKRDALKTYENF